MLADGMRRRSERSRQSCRSQLPLRCILASCSSPSGGRSPSGIRCCACSCASSCCWLAPCCCSRCCWLAPSCCSHCASSCCSAPLGLAQGPPTPVLPPRNSTASWRRSISITSSDRSYSNTCRPVVRSKLATLAGYQVQSPGQKWASRRPTCTAPGRRHCSACWACCAAATACSSSGSGQHAGYRPAANGPGRGVEGRRNVRVGAGRGQARCSQGS